jgi:CRISPR/Cas system Type II protein with McrA/HNH and RuvC-like nuclease domain
MKKSTTELKHRAKSLEDNSFYDLFQTLVECSDILKKIRSTKKRRLWIDKVIREIYDTQDGKCAICGESIELGSYEVDHIVPFCYGGGNERANIQLACLKCNRSKGKSVEPHDLLRYLEDRYMNR